MRHGDSVLLVIGYVAAHLVHIDAGLCTCLEEPDAMIFCQLPTIDKITVGQDMANNHLLLLI